MSGRGATAQRDYTIEAEDVLINGGNTLALNSPQLTFNGADLSALFTKWALNPPFNEWNQAPVTPGPGVVGLGAIQSWGAITDVRQSGITKASPSVFNIPAKNRTYLIKVNLNLDAPSIVHIIMNIDGGFYDSQSWQTTLALVQPAVGCVFAWENIDGLAHTFSFTVSVDSSPALGVARNITAGEVIFTVHST